MIRVSVFKTNDSYDRIVVSGHAGSAEYGKDIICAAVSALVINTVNSIEKFTDTDIQVNENEERGVIDIKFKLAPGNDAKLLVSSMLLGLEDIKKSQGHIDISYKEA